MFQTNGWKRHWRHREQPVSRRQSLGSPVSLCSPGRQCAATAASSFSSYVVCRVAVTQIHGNCRANERRHVSALRRVLIRQPRWRIPSWGAGWAGSAHRSHVTVLRRWSVETLQALKIAHAYKQANLAGFNKSMHIFLKFYCFSFLTTNKIADMMQLPQIFRLRHCFYPDVDCGYFCGVALIMGFGRGVAAVIWATVWTIMHCT